jgi:hypothetical protein
MRESVNQQDNVEWCHEFSPLFVGLHWPDVTEEKPVMGHNGMGRETPRQRGSCTSGSAEANRLARCEGPAKTVNSQCPNGADRGKTSQTGTKPLFDARILAALA